jgi:hypothetical protein
VVDRAVVVIADIGGYTRFMTVHRINLAHAQDVVARLLEAVIDGAKDLRVSKLEGDAVLFFAWEKDRLGLVDELLRIRASFEARKQQMEIDRLCSCEGCAQAKDLTLKFVVHAGEVAAQKVKRFTEIAGLDVIAAHRLLKNSVPLREYVLATHTVRGLFPVDVAVVDGSEDLEGIGATATFYAPLDALGAVAPAAAAASTSTVRKFTAWAGMTWRALPYMAGLKRACDGFKPMLPADTAAPSPPSS